MSEATSRRSLLAGLSATLAIVPAIASAASQYPLAPHPDAELFALRSEVLAADAKLEATYPVVDAAEKAFFEAIRSIPRSDEEQSRERSPAYYEAIARLTAVLDAEEEKAALFPNDELAELRSEDDERKRLRLESGLQAASAAQELAQDAVLELRDRVVDMQATTLEGLIFKARYAAEHHRGDYDVDVMTSIVDDLLSFALSSTMGLAS